MYYRSKVHVQIASRNDLHTEESAVSQGDLNILSKLGDS
jgi:hypothetical protein